jgi:hypothetical protein
MLPAQIVRSNQCAAFYQEGTYKVSIQELMAEKRKWGSEIF